jgi:hypothetical protein
VGLIRVKAIFYNAIDYAKWRALPPTWVHNPASELRQIIKQYDDHLKKVESLEAKLNALATLTDEAAPHHALASYGDVSRMITPKEIYKPEETRELVRTDSRGDLYGTRLR